MEQTEYSEEQLEELKSWAEDPRGRPFWDTIREMFADGIREVRAGARKGETITSARFSAHCDTLEEVLGLPSLIIQEHKKEKPSV